MHTDILEEHTIQTSVIYRPDCTALRDKMTDHYTPTHQIHMLCLKSNETERVARELAIM